MPIGGMRVAAVLLAAICTLALYRLARDIYRDPTANAATRRSLFERDALDRDRASRPGAFVLIGDSMSRGLTPRRLHDVTNLGIPGDESDRMRQRLRRYRSPATARAVLIQVGINDIAQAKPLADIPRNIAGMIQSLPPGPALLVGGIFPVSARPMRRILRVDISNEAIRTLNERIAGVCAGGACTFVDVSAMGDANGLRTAYDSGDGIHLSRAGYDAWERILEAATAGAADRR